MFLNRFTDRIYFQKFSQVPPLPASLLITKVSNSIVIDLPKRSTAPCATSHYNGSL